MITEMPALIPANSSKAINISEINYEMNNEVEAQVHLVETMKKRLLVEQKKLEKMRNQCQIMNERKKKKSSGKRKILELLQNL